MEKPRDRALGFRVGLTLRLEVIFSAAICDKAGAAAAAAALAVEERNCIAADDDDVTS